MTASTLFRALAVAALVAAPLVGCWNKPGPDTRSTIQLQMNRYDVTFDGQQRRATIGDNSFIIVRVVGEDICVRGGKLTVGAEFYGPAPRGSKVSVVGGTVAVDGEVRRPRKE